MSAITDIVSSVVHDRLRDATIDSVTVKEDVDHDGDPVLNITVVFDSDAGVLDADKLLGIARHLRSKLLEIDSEDDYFPIFSFISKADSLKMKHEAA